MVMVTFFEWNTETERHGMEAKPTKNEKLNQRMSAFGFGKYIGETRQICFVINFYLTIWMDGHWYGPHQHSHGAMEYGYLKYAPSKYY